MIHDSLLGGNNPIPEFINSKFTLDFDSQMTDDFVVIHGLEYDRRVNKRQMQMQESKIDMGKALVLIGLTQKALGQTNSARCRAGQQHTKQPEIIIEGRVDQYLETCQVKNFVQNDMVRYHYLEFSKKRLQKRDRNSTTSVPTSARIQTTTDDRKLSRSLPVSKSSRVTITAVPKADHSKCSSSFSDSKNFVCSTCHKCVFKNANHVCCITKLLKEVNSRAKIQSNKTTNSNKPVDQKSHTQKPSRQIFTGHRFSPNMTFIVSEKTSPRSDLRWKPTGRIFKSVGLRSYALSWKPCQGDSLNLPDHRIRRRCCSLIPAKSDS
ncbi:hypothetical protein Tco_0973911 [Tanacetum coccineum]|uniref:Uncharacterized protein n=1 Tax=Tanacetum coccineum TaxID=301880 RepID=A0ABQ5EA41_9ASTR